MKNRLWLCMVAIVVACGGVTAPTTVPTTTVAPTTVTSTPTSTTVAPATTTTTVGGYPKEALDYFVEVVFGSEFGDDDARIHKWEDDVRIGVFGEPNQVDLANLDTVISDLNELIDTMEIGIVDNGANVEIHFVPESRFAEIEPKYVPGNLGFFWLHWDSYGYIFDARILITSTTLVTQEERNHLVREELTQVLGLMTDSWSYEDSIFYQGWTDVQTYSELDRMLIEMLYLEEVEVGMQYDDALAVILGY